MTDYESPWHASAVRTDDSLSVIPTEKSVKGTENQSRYASNPDLEDLPPMHWSKAMSDDRRMLPFNPNGPDDVGVQSRSSCGALTVALRFHGGLGHLLYRGCVGVPTGWTSFTFRDKKGLCPQDLFTGGTGLSMRLAGGA
ncbi:hypothetical protein [Paeniglutamicibacter sp. NPDC091659]|uniref:hypothetical protein n=1 Tax=Paeniglutamicibacter sp. NPDC091659 TaxID=3364389 RepID=UPI0038108501